MIPRGQLWPDCQMGQSLLFPWRGAGGRGDSCVQPRCPPLGWRKPLRLRAGGWDGGSALEPRLQISGQGDSHQCVEESGSGAPYHHGSPGSPQELPNRSPCFPLGPTVSALRHSQSAPIKPKDRPCLASFKLSVAPAPGRRVRLSQSLWSPKCRPHALSDPLPISYLTLLAVSPSLSRTPAYDLQACSSSAWNVLMGHSGLRSNVTSSEFSDRDPITLHPCIPLPCP